MNYIITILSEIPGGLNILWIYTMFYTLKEHKNSGQVI